MAQAWAQRAKPRAVVKTSIILAIFCLGASASSGLAANLSIKGNISQTVDGSDNKFLANSPSGSMLTSNTAGTLDILAQTPTTQYLLNANLSYYKYLGRGAEDASLTWGTPASTTFTVTHSTVLDKFTLGASWSRVDVAQTQLTQSGFFTGRGSSDTYTVFGSASRDLSRLDRVTWSANASTVSFADPQQTPYVDVNTTLAWDHNLTQLTTWTNSVYFDSFSQDDLQKSERLFWRFQSGLQTKLSPLLTVHGDIDLVFANSYQRSAAYQLFNSPNSHFVAQVGAGHAVFGNVGLDYNATKTTTFSLTAAKSIIPTITGQLQQSQTVGLTVNHEINELSNLSLNTQFAQTQTPDQIGQSGATSDFLTARVLYSYRLTRKWRTNLSYTYRQRHDDTGTARSNTVLFTLSRDLNVLGNPTAINKAETERAKERAQKAIGQVFPLYR